ncbi:MAG: glycosyltransferase family 2 protein, partial [Alistipes sp.]
VSEEINNSIFRRGHTALGLSSALIGSGMAFKYSWFRNHIDRCMTAGEDKELEAMLLQEEVYIDYLENAVVLDEKVQKEGAFYNQRRRWLAAQVGALTRGIRDLPKALFDGNWDYADKLVQWMLPPRVLLLGFILLCALCTTFLMPLWSIRWWFLLLLLAFALAFATPDEQMDKPLRRALRRLPILFLLMVANLFRLRGAGHKFIHTQHEEL